MRKRKSLLISGANGDMTSMIDVVFLLLIFFMLMPFRSVEAKVESHLPKQGTGAKKTVEVDKEIEIRLLKKTGESEELLSDNGVRIIINDQEVESLNVLKVKLEMLSNQLGEEQKKDLRVLVNANEDVPFYYILSTVDISKAAGFLRLEFPDIKQR